MFKIIKILLLTSFLTTSLVSEDRPDLAAGLDKAKVKREKAQTELNQAINKREAMDRRFRSQRHDTDRNWWNVPGRMRRDDLLRKMRKNKDDIRGKRKELKRAGLEESEVADKMETLDKTQKLSKKERKALKEFRVGQGGKTRHKQGLKSERHKKDKARSKRPPRAKETPRKREKRHKPRPRPRPRP